ncbi:MAG TPA: tetratricopeptide repeat protein, partial [Planctomycetaceae bacterium]|nr:tetratricopeptide repeat protein [Planctomycetaceae bacterium]
MPRLLQSYRPEWLGLLIVFLAGSAASGWYWWVRPSDAELLQSAIRYTDRGQTGAAMARFDELLARNPSQSTALLYRGQLARDAGDLAGAEKFWKRVPDQPAREGGTARFLEGTLFLEADRPRQAEAAFLKAIELHPDYVKPHERLLKLYVAQLRAPDIKRELDAVRRFRTWTLDELLQFAYLTGKVTDTVQSIPRVEKFIENDPDDVHSLLALGRYYTWDSRFDDAISVLRRALSCAPRDPAVRAYLAEALLDQSELAEARKVLGGDTADRDAPQCVWRSHGLYWLAVGETKKAIACLTRAAAMDPNDAPAVYKLALTLKQAGDAAAAEMHFRRATLLQQLHQTLQQLHSSAFQLKEGDDGSREVAVAKAIEAGKLLTSLHRHAEAAGFFEQALVWNPDSDAARDLRARAQTRA